MSQHIHLPRLYCIVDAECFSGAPDPAARIAEFTRELMAGGATLIQYRNKSDHAREMLDHGREMRRIVQAVSIPQAQRSAKGKRKGAARVKSQRPTTKGQRPVLIMNDRVDVCLAADFDGVHLGQDDLSIAAARRIAGKPLWVGVSTHTVDQVAAADAGDADYIAIGPVFATGSKWNPDPVIGLETVRRARAATRKPLVAIGGITRRNFREVLDAGADSVAVIRDLLEDPRAAVEEFLAG